MFDPLKSSLGKRMVMVKDKYVATSKTQKVINCVCIMLVTRTAKPHGKQEQCPVFEQDALLNKTLPRRESKGQQTENPLMTGFPKSQCIIQKNKNYYYCLRGNCSYAVPLMILQVLKIQTVLTKGVRLV